MDIVRILLALILPPLAVFLEGGLRFHFWLNLALTIFGFWIGGILHALWFILSREPSYGQNVP